MAASIAVKGGADDGEPQIRRGLNRCQGRTRSAKAAAQASDRQTASHSSARNAAAASAAPAQVGQPGPNEPVVRVLLRRDLSALTSAELAAQRLQRAMQIDLQRPFAAAGGDPPPRKAIAPPTPEPAPPRVAARQATPAPRSHDRRRQAGTGRRIALVSQRFQNRAANRPRGLAASDPPQQIDSPPLGDHAQPCGERAGRIVSPARTMDGQQHILHDIVDLIGPRPAAARWP